MENSKFVEKLSRIGFTLGNNIYLQSISQGVMGILPILIVGSFASLFSGLPIQMWQSFMQQSGLASCLSVVVNATTNMLGLLFTYNICKVLATKMDVRDKIIPILAIVMYLILMPVTVSEQGTSALSFEYLGTKGMIVGIIISIIVCHLYKLIVNKDITIKMPEGTPAYVAESFLGLIPAFIIIIVAMIIRMIVTMTPYGDTFNLVYSILQIPLTALIGGSLFANIIFRLLIQVSWALGVHPGYLSGMIAPILFSLDGMNQAFYAQGQEVPNIIGMAFSYITSTAGFYPAIAVAILIFAKSKRLNTVGKVAVAPAFFGISEPLIFGVPIAYNPLIIIPWLLGPIVNFLIGYFLTSIGLVARCAGVTVFNIPMVFTGLMNGSISIAIMEVGLFILNILMFMPFIKIIDKEYMRDELALDSIEER